MAEVTLQTSSSIVSQVESDHTTWNLPRKLLKVRPPLCAYCKAGTMTRMPWHVKKKPTTKSKNSPGDCVSMEQLEFCTPGFVGVMRRLITNRRYTCATIFIDHFSGLSYVHLQKIVHYRGDNSRETSIWSLCSKPWSCHQKISRI